MPATATLPTDATLLADLQDLADRNGCKLIPSNGGVAFTGERGARGGVETEIRSIGYRCHQLNSLDQLKVWI